MKLNRILLMADAPAGGGTAAAAPQPKPAAAPAPVAPTPAAAPEPSNDPFEPPKKSAPNAAPKPDEKPVIAAPDEIDKLAPKELRERVKQLKSESQAATTAKLELEKKIAAFEVAGKNTTALTSRLNAVEKECDELQGKIRAQNYQESDDYKKNFAAPFESAAKHARELISKLNIVDENGAIVRKADWDSDFKKLFHLHRDDPTAAIERAESMFGKAASIVVSKINALEEMQRKSEDALAEERAQFKTRNEQEVANQTKERETVFGKWKDTNSKLAESNPDYKDDPTDTEASEARKHALSIFDSEIKAADRQDFIEKKVLRDAHIRQRVGAFPVLKLQLARANEKLEAAQNQIEELKGAAPGKVQRPSGGAAPAVEEDWGSGLVEAAKG